MTENIEIRDDLPDYEVLENEGECFVDDKRRSSRVTNAWVKAVARVDCASSITVGISKGKLFVGYHSTLSGLTTKQLVNLGRYIGGYNGLVSLAVYDGDYKEAYIVFYFPVRVLRNTPGYKKLLKQADKAVALAWA